MSEDGHRKRQRRSPERSSRSREDDYYDYDDRRREPSRRSDPYYRESHYSDYRDNKDRDYSHHRSSRDGHREYDDRSEAYYERDSREGRREYSKPGVDTRYEETSYYPNARHSRDDYERYGARRTSREPDERVDDRPRTRDIEVQRTRDSYRDEKVFEAQKQTNITIEHGKKFLPIDKESNELFSESKVQHMINKALDPTVKQENVADSAKKAAAEIDEIVKARRLKLEKWKKENESKVSDTANQSSWNLENDDDDIDGDNNIDPLALLKAANETSKEMVNLKKDSKNGSDDELLTVPKKKLLFGKRITDSSKQVIGFGIRSTLQPKPISKRLVLDSNEDEVDIAPVPDITRSDENIESKDDQQIQNALESDADDALDQFMQDVHVEVQKTADVDMMRIEEVQSKLSIKSLKEELFKDEEEPEEELSVIPISAAGAEYNFSDFLTASEAKKKELPTVDHSKITYEPFRKDFYMEPPDLAKLTPEEVDQMRIDLDGIYVRGLKCPKPVEKWSQFGMPPGIQEVIKKFLKYERPTPIQSQAIPAIMSGRDVIGIARTGSGKTIAFILPMLRHIRDQRPSGPQEGPIGLIMTPTRELAQQIYKECKHFVKVLNLRVCCCYGGTPLKDQIAEVKRGAEIIICTPGRMIDLLTANNGRVTNLRRVSYLVLDEADRMFDMGFEPQVMKILDNVQPGRQTLLFSATFPRFMEGLARKVLTKPLEIIVGARSVVSSDITQIVLVLKGNEDARFMRLLAILGKQFSDDPDMKVLIFVDRQGNADEMMSMLMKRGYPCLSLHGGKDQADRDSVIQDFKNNAANIMVATSVAARGLDIKELKLVINFDCPNHMEDYVHRCGRTGRAGNKGVAYTFVRPDQGKYAVEIIKALKASKVDIPKNLQSLAEKYLARVRNGVARIAGSGFGGRGLHKLIDDRIELRKNQHAELAIDAEKPVEADGGPGAIATTGLIVPNSSRTRAVVREEAQAVDKSADFVEKSIRSVQERMEKWNNMLPAERARQMALRLGKEHIGTGRVTTDAPCWAEVDINDFPHPARIKITSKDQIQRLVETSGAAVTCRGIYVPPGRVPPHGERKLYLVNN